MYGYNAATGDGKQNQVLGKGPKETKNAMLNSESSRQGLCYRVLMEGNALKANGRAD